MAAPRAFWCCVPRRDAVALTFDDGPDATYTPQLLSLLKQHSVRCTFFLLGKAAEQHPDLVAAIHQAGHTIGLHTYSHTTLDRMSADQFQQEVTLCQGIIERITGHRPHLLRPPEGRVKLRHLRWASARGITLVHYTITSNDWKATAPTEILDAVQPGALRGGEIISFHDTNSHTIQAIPIVLQQIQARQLSIIPLSPSPR